MRRLAIGVRLARLWLATPYAWNNGQAGNTGTNTAAECKDPPYATHDWIADHAGDRLPDNEKAWLEPHGAIYLLEEVRYDKNRLYHDRIFVLGQLWNHGSAYSPWRILGGGAVYGGVD